MTGRRTALGLLLGLASAATVLASPTGTTAATVAGVAHSPVYPVRFRPPAVPARPAPQPPPGQHITGHPAVLAAVNAARARRGWPAARAGSNTAAEACALNATRCNGVQWGGCGLTPLAGERYTLTIGTAESDGPRGCVQAISFSSFGSTAAHPGRSFRHNV